MTVYQLDPMPASTFPSSGLQPADCRIAPKSDTVVEDPTGNDLMQLLLARMWQRQTKQQ